MEAIETTYFDKCDVKRMDNVLQPNGTYIQQRVTVYSNVSCALSIGTRPALNSITEYSYKQGESLNLIQTQDRLFLNPSYIITQGDELTITHYGRTITATAGRPYLYSSHQVLVAEDIQYA